MSYLRNFDLNLLRVFDAIYDTGSVSAAARKLAVSQPSISRELNRLRDHFDDQLFVRSGNGVAPTAKASSMLVDVRDVLSLIDKTIDTYYTRTTDLCLSLCLCHAHIEFKTRN